MKFVLPPLDEYIPLVAMKKSERAVDAFTNICREYEYTPSLLSLNCAISRVYEFVPVFHLSPLFSLRSIENMYAVLFDADLVTALIMVPELGGPYSCVPPTMSTMRTSPTEGDAVSTA